jgi:hypothetical protein
MRPTFDATAEKMVSVFADKLREGLDEVAKG